jgi:hypothetical protein
LASAPTGLTIEELGIELERRKILRPARDVVADIMVLITEGVVTIIEDNPKRYAIDNKLLDLATRDLADNSQAVLQGILTIMEDILPALQENPSRGRFINVCVNTKEHYGFELMAHLRDTLRSTLQEHLTESGGTEMVTMVVGMAVTRK